MTNKLSSWEKDSLIEAVIEQIQGFDIMDIYEKEAISEGAAENCDIDDVYEDNIIIDYVSNNFQVGQVFEGDEIKEHVTGLYAPDQVFSEDQLEQWALDNGFVIEGPSND